METEVDDRSLLRLFESVLPLARWKVLERRSKAQIYSLRVVVWMMLLQRLNERGTQQRAVDAIAQGHVERLLPASKRVREGRISENTGAYARACGRLSTEPTAAVCDEVLAELNKRIAPVAELGRPMMLLDGSSLSVEHSVGLLDAFPAGRNQRGLGHWGVVKWVALHDVQTGIALRPEWGPMYGPEAVSEPALARRAVERTAARSVIVGDGNFGIFSFAYAVVGSKREVLFRLTQARAQALGSKRLLPNGECRVCWRPSSFERKKYPELPADAAIEGRLIVVTQKGFRDSWYLFTTLSEDTPAEKIVAWYRQRWNLELDLRTLKGTLRLKHMQGKTKAVVEKEFLIAVVAYGMVRALMAEAAQRVGLHPRQLSFTRAHGLLNAMTGKLCSPHADQRQQAYDRLLVYIGRAKLPKRSKTRTYPRAVWGSGKYYPGRQADGTQLQSK
ncbi:MAG: IS4 family transposase [Acidobacteriaceae bacterium]|nr:IS4 family transposase [Acidobacteriaceae bacterium]